MKMLLLFILTLSLSDHNEFVIRQGDVNVSLADIDALILGIPAEIRFNVVEKNDLLEKNIYSTLNLNIIYNHVKSHGLLDTPKFKNIAIELDQDDADIKLFAENLGYKFDELVETTEHFEFKKIVFKKFLEYSEEQVDSEYAKELAMDYYLVNKDKYTKPEQRDLSVIEIDKDSEHAESVKSILKNLLNNQTDELFNEYAVKYSNDPSVNLNQGYLGLFQQSQYIKPFTEDVFNTEYIGVMNQLFVDEEHFYIVKVNKIVPEKVIPFSEVRVSLIEEVIDNVSRKYVQNIINTSSEKIDINSEIAALVFNRYDFLINPVD